MSDSNATEVETPSTEAAPPPAPKRKGYWSRFTGNFLWVSIALHAALILIATYLVVSTITARPKPEFKSGPKGANPSTRALEHKVSMVQKQNTMSAPPMAKRIATTGKSAIVLPDLPTIATSDDFAPTQMANMNPAATGFAPATLSAGGGGGGGPTINFFGLQSKGNRIAFLLDYSGTMSGARLKALVEEFNKALKKLPDTAEVMIILWSGHAWMVGEDPRQTMDKWKKITNRHFELTSAVPAPTWTKLTGGNRKKIENAMTEAKIFAGFTDLRAPWLWLQRARPAPDVVFFMTDGQREERSQGSEKAAREYMDNLAGIIKKLPPTMSTNIIAIDAGGRNPEWIEDLQYLGRQAKAKVTVIK